MAGRKLVRDLHLYRQPLFLQLTSKQQVSSTRVRLISANGYLVNRRFSVFNEFSKKIKGEATNNPEFQQTVKELKEKAEELKGVKEELKIRTKQTTEQLYKQVDGAWTEAEAAAKKVSANVKEKISAATEEVKGTFGIGKEEASGPSAPKSEHTADAGEGTKYSSGEYKQQQSGSSNTEEPVSGKSSFGASSSYFTSAFSRIKEAKFVDLAKKGYGIVKDELSGNTSKRKHLEFDPSTVPKVETSTDIVTVPQSRWNKTLEAIRMKVQSYPLFKRIDELRKPVTNRTQEIAEDMREHWEASDSAIVRKIQDLNETIFQETDTAASIKQIRWRDPSFSLVDFLAEVQDAVKPVLNAYIKGDIETLKKYCSKEVLERCKAEHDGLKSHGIFFDNKILHISEAEVKETKMLGDSPIIIVMFQTQQIYCVRDKDGNITDGGQDTIHTVYYAWAMQQVDPEELGQGAIYPIWRIREMQQFGVQALI